MKKLTLKKLFKSKNFDKLSKDQIRRFVLRELILLFYEVAQVRKDGRVKFVEVVGLVDNAVKLARIAFNADKLKEAFVLPSVMIDMGTTYGVDELRDDIDGILPDLKKEGIVFIPSTERDDAREQIVAVVELVHALISLIKSFK